MTQQVEIPLVLFYGVPALICSIGYFIEAAKGYMTDRESRAHYHKHNMDYHYYPTLTLGVIIWWMFIALCPVVNIVAAILDVLPEAFQGVFKFLKKVFDMPLVPEFKDKK